MKRKFLAIRLLAGVGLAVFALTSCVSPDYVGRVAGLGECAVDEVAFVQKPDATPAAAGLLGVYTYAGDTTKQWPCSTLVVAEAGAAVIWGRVVVGSSPGRNLPKTDKNFVATLRPSGTAITDPVWYSSNVQTVFQLTRQDDKLLAEWKNPLGEGSVWMMARVGPSTDKKQ